MDVAIIIMPTKATDEVCVIGDMRVLYRESIPKRERCTVLRARRDARQWALDAGYTIVSLKNLAREAHESN